MERKSENVLIVFLRNPVEGRVKSRLAASVGEQKALSVYRQLNEHTRQVALECNADTHVFYSDFVDHDDQWLQSDFGKHQQEGDDSGTRMLNALIMADEMGYSKKVIIGSDCPEITTEIINDAFQKLDEYDVVIGPAMGGDYYLVGVEEIYTELFKEIDWDSKNVFDQTIRVLQNNGVIWYETPILSDVEVEEDLPKMRKISSRSLLID